MKFDKKDLEKISKLARLSLTAEEEEKLILELDKIVSFVAQLNQVNVESVEPLCYPYENFLNLREDVALKTIGIDGIKSSQGYYEGLVKVPKIIE